MNSRQSVKIKFSPTFVAVFAVCFALGVGSVWEIYEFGMDSILGLNMQKTMLQGGEALSGHLAVADTMKDIIADICGGLVAAFVAYFSLKNKKGWVNEYMN